SVLDELESGSARGVRARRVRKDIAKRGQHRLDDARVARRGRVVVEVDEAFVRHGSELEVGRSWRNVWGRRAIVRILAARNSLDSRAVTRLAGQQTRWRRRRGSEELSDDRLDDVAEVEGRDLPTARSLARGKRIVPAGSLEAPLRCRSLRLPPSLRDTAALGLARARRLHPSCLDELDDARELVAIEPVTAAFAPVDDDTGAAGEVLAIHELSARRAGEIAHLVRLDEFRRACARSDSGDGRRGLLAFFDDRLEGSFIEPEPAA